MPLHSQFTKGDQYHDLKKTEAGSLLRYYIQGLINHFSNTCGWIRAILFVLALVINCLKHLTTERCMERFTTLEGSFGNFRYMLGIEKLHFFVPL